MTIAMATTDATTHNHHRNDHRHRHRRTVASAHCTYSPCGGKRGVIGGLKGQVEKGDASGNSKCSEVQCSAVQCVVSERPTTATKARSRESGTARADTVNSADSILVNSNRPVLCSLPQARSTTRATRPPQCFQFSAKSPKEVERISDVATG